MLKYRLSRIKTEIWAHALVLVGMLSIPLRSFVPPECTKEVTGPLGLSFIFNCDSALFMQDSQRPERLFEADTSYQDRPLYPLLAHLMAQIIRFFLPGGRVFSNHSGEAIEFQYANLIAYWTISFVVLFGALSLLLRGLARFPQLSAISKLAIVSLIFLNEVTKGFFWTPHTQIFSLFLIAFAIYSWGKFSFDEVSRRFEFIWFVSSALLIFFYPILALALVVPVLANPRKHILISPLALLPYLIYPKILTLLGGTYRNPQVEDANQFVWVLDSNAFRLMWENFNFYIKSFSLPHLLLLLVLLALFLFNRKSSRHDSLNDKKLVGLYGFLVAYGLFLYFIGTYVHRLPIPFLCMTASVVVLTLALRRSQTIQVVASSVALAFSVGLFFLTQGTIA